LSGAVLAVDPGREKCGVAVLTADGTVLLQEVVPTAQLAATAARLIHTYAPTVIMGNGTTSAAARARIEELGTEVTLVDEYRTTDAAKAAPSIGKTYQIDTEKLISLSPDLVILNRGMNEKLIDTLGANGIKTLVLDGKSYDDVKREIGILAALTGEQKKGEELVQKMDSDLDAVRRSIPQEKKRVAIIHSTGQGLSVQLDGSIAGCIANMLGWENTAAGMPALDKNPDAAPYSMETLVAQNPDILFVTSMGNEAEIRASMEAMFADNPAWQSVTAIREGKVYYLPQEMFLFSPGLDYPAAAKYMAGLVYP